MTTIRTALFAAFAFALSAPAFADGFVVDIHGNYNTNTRVGDVKAAASGEKARADINIAGVQGSGLVDYSATVVGGNIATSATGQNASSLANVGGVQGFKQ
jgi:hypothetical protein